MQSTQAAHTLASHLRAHGYHVNVQGIHITLSHGDCQVEVTPTAKECGAICSSDSQATLQAINSVLRRAKLPAIESATYRPILTKRARLDSDFEDIVLRSKMFARCPNPDPQVMKLFEPLARRTAGRVFLRFRLPLKAFGYEREDLESVALVHLVTAIHRYRVGDVERDTMVLGRYLRQRLMEVVRKVQRKALQCSSDSRTRNFADVQFFLDTGAQSAAE